jgi:hypothetical protein
MRGRIAAPDRRDQKIARGREPTIRRHVMPRELGNGIHRGEVLKMTLAEALQVDDARDSLVDCFSD